VFEGVSCRHCFARLPANCRSCTDRSNGDRTPAAAAERFRRIFPEQRMIIVREASKLDEAMLDGDLCDGGRRRVAVPQNGMDGTKPFVAQEGDRSQTENLVECTMQGPSRDVQLRTDFGNVHGPAAGGVEIIIDVPYQVHRRGQGPSGVRRQ